MACLHGGKPFAAHCILKHFLFHSVSMRALATYLPGTGVCSRHTIELREASASTTTSMHANDGRSTAFVCMQAAHEQHMRQVQASAGAALSAFQELPDPAAAPAPRSASPGARASTLSA